ncbi:MAG: hypothetical protein QM731_24085 [Chitinophagaceae bacterium]
MEPFVTHPVVFIGKKQNILLLVLIGLFLVAISIAIGIGEKEIATWLFLALVAIVVVIAVIIKGRFLSFDLSPEKLTITPDKITLGTKTYNISEASKLVFAIEAYKGMLLQAKGKTRYLSVASPGASDGMDNYLSFRYQGHKVEIRFYLNSRKHAVMLCDVFRELYKRKISFVEVDMYGQQTYLMQKLNEDELDEFKRKYGYLG